MNRKNLSNAKMSSRGASKGGSMLTAEYFGTRTQNKLYFSPSISIGIASLRFWSDVPQTTDDPQSTL